MYDVCPRCKVDRLPRKNAEIVFKCGSYTWEDCDEFSQSERCKLNVAALQIAALMNENSELQAQVRHLQEANEYNIKKLKAMPTLDVPVNLGWFQIDTFNVPNVVEELQTKLDAAMELLRKIRKFMYTDLDSYGLLARVKALLAKHAKE